MYLERSPVGRGQGYLYARPLPAHELEPLLADGRIRLPGAVDDAFEPMPIQRTRRVVA